MWVGVVVLEGRGDGVSSASLSTPPFRSTQWPRTKDSAAVRSSLPPQDSPFTPPDHRARAYHPWRRWSALVLDAAGAVLAIAC